MEKLHPPFAVMDLGTNTFHLLIARVDSNDIQVLHKEKIFVKLASGGIDFIEDRKLAFGLQTLKAYKETINRFNVKNVRVCGTEGLRKARNADQFINSVKEEIGLDIEVIDGQREAELIHKGVSKCIPLNHKNTLIVDIGGGSTEFIIANAKQVHWTISLPLGASVLKNKYHKEEPIAPNQYNELMTDLEVALQAVFQAAERFQVADIIGSSGSFDSIVNMLKVQSALYPSLSANYDIIEVSAYRTLHLQLLNSNLEQRLEMEGLVTERAEMMVVASCVISLLLSKLNQRSLLVSHFALKEGLLAEIQEEVLVNI